KDSGNRLYWRANRHRLTAEQIRDSLLATSGALDLKMSGPPEPLTPFYARRTIYGRISRYRLDDFLQLFDFPSPNLSSERRFATNVPLQRLFLMNSDFMQQQAELLARRIEGEPDAAAKIQKAYRLIFGRRASALEEKTGLTYLASEPMKAYEERKNTKDTKDTKVTKKQAKPAGGIDDEDGPGDAMGDGMMAGVKPGAGKDTDKKKLLPVTPWGRYLKVLLSSSEFLFVSW